MANPSFDIVSKVDRQEVDNALQQASRELATRFDFRGTGAEITWAGEEAVTVQAETEERAKAMSQPRTDVRQRGSAAPGTSATTTGSSTRPADSGESATSDPPKKVIRSVGPTFLQTQ